MEKIARSHPKKTANQWNDEGLKFFQQKNYQQALTCFLAAIEINPRDPSYAKNVGETYFHLGDVEKAVGYYRRAIWLDNSRADYYNDIGVIYENSDQFRIALHFYQKAREMDPSTIEYFENEAKMLRKIGEYHQALRAYQLILKRNPKNSTNHNNIGIIYFSLQEYELAFQEFKTAQIIDSENITYKQNMADALRHMAKFSEAIDLYHQILDKNPADDLSWNFLGLCYIQRLDLGDLALAKKALKQATLLSPNNGNYWSSLGQSYRLGHNYLSAISAYKKAEQLQPDNYLILNNLGLCYYLKHDLVHAKKYMSESLKYQPDDKTLLENLIQILIELQDYADAMPLFKQIQKLQPLDDFLKNAYGKCLGHEKQYEEAFQNLQAAIDRAPQNTLYYLDLIDLLNEQFAETYFTNVLKQIDAQKIVNQNIFSKIAQIYLKQSDYDHAYLYFEKAYQLDHNDEELLRQIIHCVQIQQKHNEIIYFTTEFLTKFYPSIEMLLLRADSYRALDNDDLAEKDIETAKKMDPDNNLNDQDFEKNILD